MCIRDSNYDSTFLAMLLTGLSGGSAQPCIPRSCGYKPFQKKRLFAPDSDALRFSADFNVALAWYKLRDDWQDEKKVSALAGKGLLRRAAKQVSAERPNICLLYTSHKCDYKKQIHEELLETAVAEVITKLVSNPKFAALMQQKISMKVDTSAIEPVSYTHLDVYKRQTIYSKFPKGMSN